MSKLPWEPGFVPALPDTNLAAAVEKAVQDATQAATNLGTAVAGTVAGPTAAAAVQDVGKVATSVEQAAGSVVTAATGAPPISQIPSTQITGLPSTNAPVGGDVISIIEQAALEAAKTTSAAVLPGIEKAIQARVAAKVQAEAADLIRQLEGGASEPAVPSLDDFTKADARSRAFRTLIIGVVLSVGWGLVNILGNLATVDWTNKDAFPQVAALAVGSVVTSVTAYIARILKEPAHITAATIIPGSS